MGTLARIYPHRSVRDSLETSGYSSTLTTKEELDRTEGNIGRQSVKVA